MPEEPQRIPRLIGEAASLPGFAQLALVARCACRVVPVYQPKHFGSTEIADEIADEILAMDVCAEVAALCAVSPEPEYVPIASGASAAAFLVSSTAAPEAAISAKLCAAYVASAAATYPAGINYKEIESSLKFYFGAAKVFEGGWEPAEKAALQDFYFLMGLDLGGPDERGRVVPRGFFDRPLWPPISGIPPAWLELTNKWASTLESLEFWRFYDRYLQMCQGGEFLWQDTEIRVVHWAVQQADRETQAAAAALAKRKEIRLPPPERRPPPVAEVPTEFTALPSVEAAPEDISTEGVPFVPDREARKRPARRGPGKKRTEPPKRVPPLVTTEPAEETEPAPEAPAGRPGLQMLADAPIEDEKQDRLGFVPYVEALAGIINHPETKTPLVLAINAPWGAGKSSLGRMVKRRLEDNRSARGRKPHLTCWFNAWMHDDAPNLASAFAAEVAQAANARRPVWWRLLNPVSPSVLPSSEQRARRVLAVLVIVLLALLASRYIKFGEILGALVGEQQTAREAPATSPPGAGAKQQPDTAATVAAQPAKEGLATPGAEKSQAQPPSAGTEQQEGKTLGGTGILPDEQVQIIDWVEKRLGKRFAEFVLAVILITLLMKILSPVVSAAKALGGFIADPHAAAGKASLGSASRQLRELIRQALPPGSRFVIFVDDLERCRPPRAVDVLEVVNQLLGHEDVVTVVMADMPAVVACADLKYERLAARYQPSGAAPGKSSTHGYGWSYLQKIIQIQFDIPPHTPEQVRELASNLTAPPESVAEQPSVVEKTLSWLAEKTLPLIPKTLTDGMFIVTLIGLFSYAIYFLSVRGQRVIWVDLSMLLIPAGWAVIWLMEWFDDRELRKSRDSAKKAIAEETNKGSRDIRAIAQSVRSRLSIPVEQEKIIREAAALYVTDESEIRAEAEGEAMKHLMPLPRSAIRVLNRLRILLVIAHEKMLFNSRDFRAAHIGKWAVLWERWPQLLMTLSAQAERMQGLESDAQTWKMAKGNFEKGKAQNPAKADEKKLKAADKAWQAAADAFMERVKVLSPAYAGDADLLEFCASEPKLGPVLSRLVHFGDVGAET